MEETSEAEVATAVGRRSRGRSRQEEEQLSATSSGTTATTRLPFIDTSDIGNLSPEMQAYYKYGRDRWSYNGEPQTIISNFPYEPQAQTHPLPGTQQYQALTTAAAGRDNNFAVRSVDSQSWWKTLVDYNPGKPGFGAGAAGGGGGIGGGGGMVASTVGGGEYLLTPRYFLGDCETPEEQISSTLECEHRKNPSAAKAPKWLAY
eukprot:g19180.t1